MVTLFFRPGPVRSFARGAPSRPRAASPRFHAHCLEAGVYLPPSQFEAAFVSLAHDDAAIDAVGRRRPLLLPRAAMIAEVAIRAAGREPTVGVARSAAAPAGAAVYGPRVEQRFALGLETIYEGYLVHHAESRLFAPADRAQAILLGDYLYAAGLVDVCHAGELRAVATLAELIATVSDHRSRRLEDDGAAWEQGRRGARAGDRMKDLRDWIELLRAEGELAEITAEVDPHLEITEIADRTMKAGGPALLFRNVRGSPMPVLINQFGTERRMCLALGVESLDEVARSGRRRARAAQPPQGLGATRCAPLGKLKSLADVAAEDRQGRAVPGGRARRSPTSTGCRS